MKATYTMLPKHNFSTAARVHPSIHPHLQHHARAAQQTASASASASSMALRRLPVKSLSALLVSYAALSYAYKTYTSSTMLFSDASAGHHSAEEETRLRNEALADAYGDRDSLESLQKAAEFYESRNRNR